MALRYPIDVQGRGTPFILFTSHRAKYKAAATQTTLTDNKSCALYMPPGFQVADIMRYESASPGLLGGVAENLLSDNNDYSAEDIRNIASTGAAAATQAAAATIGNMSAFDNDLFHFSIFSNQLQLQSTQTDIASNSNNNLSSSNCYC